MNKVVLEHFPVEKLPDELRVQFAGQSSVKLTVEPEKPAGYSSKDLLALLERLPIKASNSVESIRALRDEWD